MRGFAEFVMRGRWQAIMVMVAASSLPFLAWLGGAVLALVTLRRGARDGAFLVAGAAAVVALVYLLFGLSPMGALRPMLELWLPVLIGGYWLRRTVSLSSTLRLLSGMAGLLVVGFHLLVADPEAYWRGILQELGRLFTDGAPEAEQAWMAMVEQLLPIMTGLLAMTVLVMVTLSLLLGRSLQAALYNPGGFREEFHGLDLGRAYALGVAGLLVGAMFAGGGMLSDLMIVMGAPFVLQALAVAHSVVARQAWSSGWLIAVYALVPLAFQLLMVAGMIDTALNWRRLVTDSGSDGPPGS